MTRQALLQASRILIIVLFCTGCAVQPASPQPPVTPASAMASPSVRFTATVPLFPSATPRAPITVDSPTVAATTIPTPESSPDGPTADVPMPNGIVIFQRPDLGSLEAIHLATGVHTVLADPTEPGQHLPWSMAPNGRTIAVVTGRGWAKGGLTSGDSRAALWAVAIDGSNPRRLLDLTLDGLPTTPVGAPTALTNGAYQKLPWIGVTSEVVVASAHEGTVDLYAVAVDSGQVRRLTNSPELEFQATVSPDEVLLSFGSTVSFGTGAGWLQSGIGTVPTRGGEMSWLLQPGGMPATDALQLAGWINDELLAILIEPGGVASSLVALSAVALPRTLFHAPGSLAVAIGSGRVAVAGTATGDQQVAVWSAGQPEAQPITTMPGVERLVWSPDGRALLICTNARYGARQRVIWRDERKIALPEGSCASYAWGLDGRLALGGESNDSALPAESFIPDGSLLHTLPPGALPVGWSGGDLFAFIPGAGAAPWQLFRFGMDKPAIAVGPSLNGIPHGAILIPEALD